MKKTTKPRRKNMEYTMTLVNELETPETLFSVMNAIMNTLKKRNIVYNYSSYDNYYHLVLEWVMTRNDSHKVAHWMHNRPAKTSGATFLYNTILFHLNGIAKQTKQRKEVSLEAYQEKYKENIL